MQNIPDSIGEVIEQFCDLIHLTQPEDRAKNICREVKSGAARFLAPALGFQPPHSRKRMRKVDQKAAMAFLSTKSVQLLPKMLGLMDAYFEERHIKLSIRNTYGGRLRKVHDFAAEQPWYPGYRKSIRFQDECAPPLPGLGDMTHTIVMPGKCNRKWRYRLTSDEIITQLQAELEDFRAFCCASHYLSRAIKICSESTANKHIETAELFLGWWIHYYQPEITPNDLSLQLLIPVITVDELEDLSPKVQKQKWREAKATVKAWVHNYFEFMGDHVGAYSPNTRLGRLHSLQRIAHWLYRHEVESLSEYNQIPIFQAIADLRREWKDKATEWKRQNKSVADRSKKWPDTPPNTTALAVLRQGLLTNLCLRCRPRSACGTLHKNLSQAKFYATFLMWAELAFEPPRRQQEFRTRRIALACPITRPREVPPDGFYHPLPPAEVRELDAEGKPKDNYLYKTYFHHGKEYPKGIWIRQITTYKTNRTYGQQDIILPNRMMPDGKPIYDYLESYLYGTWYCGGTHEAASLYDWWDPELKGRRGRWLTGGVMEFQPALQHVSHPKVGDWPWMPCFPTPNTGRAYTPSKMSSSLARAAHQWTGKRIAPHMMRNIWATWAFQVGLGDKAVHSLAYAMGTSYDILKRTYEKSTPEDKRRPIEEAVDEDLLEYLAQIEEHTTDKTGVELRKVLHLLPRLSKEELQTVQKVVLGG
ncbi:hypothetical protein H6F75_26755 [Nodosilinea sp. FACHB-131]|uniref:hypothetical protein n=1 Tax=Cyanophyceae TaxID=3028117 RepID=UPI001686065F|nr:hypothetical protein [Nodosilinea sp. FACHB-131]MBD1877091.1 hypothetical protein [Nodosilinea sp. FACHB-131]